jgi:hypothetical protein
MASDRSRKTLADYVTISLSPALIMALVVSLIFFLIEVLYAGQYSGQLQWTLFFFVFAMVLVARISMEMGTERAGVYGLVMLGVGWLALQQYLKYPEDSPMAGFGWLVNLGLMCTIWWCANQLTWDCTHIDDQVDASGKGVLEAAGLDADAPPATEPVQEDTQEPVHTSGIIGWFDRYQRYRKEQSRKPHTPGVWVIYFSLAALPIFGVGQALIPAADQDRRRYVFWLMVCYVASGLGLLVTTSYLGLRRYLRQRKVKMPAAITGVWLFLGAGMIAVLMVIGALLPRPYGEYQILHIKALGSEERSSSNYAMRGGGAGKGQSQSASDAPREKKEAKSGSGTEPGDDGNGKSQTKSKSGQSSKGKNGSGKSGSEGGKNDSKSQQKDDTQNDSDKDKDKDEDKDKQDDKSQGPNAAEKKDANKGRLGKSDEQSQQAKSAQQSENQTSKSPANPLSKAFSALGRLATFLKWILVGIIALVVGFFLFRAGLRFLANFTDWAKSLLDAFRSWWEALFGTAKKSGVNETQDDDGDDDDRPRPVPFAAFHDPFQSGRADSMSPNDLVQYSFEALESWAYERDLGREPRETPLEFAARLANEVPALEADAQRLATLYARVAYARSRLGAGARPALKQFWERIYAINERPLSV